VQRSTRSQLLRRNSVDVAAAVVEEAAEAVVGASGH
jgi:hypothetical protein